MEVLKIDRTKLFTQSEYAKKLGVSRSYINHMVRDKLLNVIEIKGAKLIYAE
jgi:predicted XRE-type DNA-binding protein